MSPFDGGLPRRETRPVAAKKQATPTARSTETPLQLWARMVRDADWAFTKALVESNEGKAVDPRKALGLRPWQAVQAASYLASIFEDPRHELQPLEAAIIDRVAEAMQPRKSIDKAVLAADLVAEHAVRYQEAAAGGANYKGNTTLEILTQLDVTLWSAVHERFSDLGGHFDATGLLLLRYTASRGKRTAAGKGEGRLSAEQIVVALNRLVRFPLGKDLNYRSIQNTRPPKRPALKK